MQKKRYLSFPDQDAINQACFDNKLILEKKYGVLVRYFCEKDFLKDFSYDELEDLLDDPKIVHYAGYQPWIHAKNKSVHSSLWWDEYQKMVHPPRNLKKEYFVSMIKNLGRKVLTGLGIARKGSKYYAHQYFDHKKLTKAVIFENFSSLNDKSGTVHRRIATE